MSFPIKGDWKTLWGLKGLYRTHALRGWLFIGIFPLPTLVMGWMTRINYMCCMIACMQPVFGFVFFHQITLQVFSLL